MYTIQLQCTSMPPSVLPPVTSAYGLPEYRREQHYVYGDNNLIFRNTRDARSRQVYCYN